MSQTKTLSWVEATTSTLIGLAVAFTTQLLVFPVFGIYVPITTNLYISSIFTGVSVVRGYLVRRLFNRLGVK